MRSKHKAQVIQANPAPTESAQFNRLTGISFPRHATLSSSDARAELAGLMGERRPLAEPSEPLAGGTIQGSSCFFSSCRLAVLKSTKTLTYGQSKEAEIRRWLTPTPLSVYFPPIRGVGRTKSVYTPTFENFYCLTTIP